MSWKPLQYSKKNGSTSYIDILRAELLAPAEKFDVNGLDIVLQQDNHSKHTVTLA